MTDDKNQTDHNCPRDPADFGLASFLDLLPTRTPLIGQCATSYETFRLGHLRDLQPTTALQCTVCENLIANEWDLMQHRRMRDRVIANKLADLVERAAFEALKQAHEDKLDAELQAWVDAGNEESAWEETPFNHNDARMDATDLARGAKSTDREKLAAVETELENLGVDMVALMAAAHEDARIAILRFEGDIRDLEKRRREIKGDFDALKKAAPIDLARDEFEDAEIVE